MTRADWILVRTRQPDVIREGIVEFSEAPRHLYPTERTAEVEEVEPGLHAVTFSQPLGAIQFLNTVGFLIDWPGVDEALGWITGLDEIRYRVERHPTRNVEETQFLRGINQRGQLFDLYLPEGWMCERSGMVDYEEPQLELGRGRIREWNFTLELDRYLPRLARTHDKDHSWEGVVV